MGFSFVTECGLFGRKGFGPVGILLDSSLEHISSTRCELSELSWLEMFRTNLELKLVLLSPLNTAWESERN